MQIALQDIRRWGNLKIAEHFFPCWNDRLLFIQKLSLINSNYNFYKASAYSFPRKHKNISYNSRNLYSGIESFILDCEPMIDNIEIDDICQRRFRNSWNSLWKSFCEDLEFSDSEKIMLSELGIRLAYILSEDTDYSDLQDVIDFYNAVIRWSLFTKQESNFEKNDLSFISVMEMLVTSNSSDFVNNFVLDLI